MTTALIILGIAVLAVAGLVAFAASRPDRFRVVRSIAVAAPAERIVPLIADFRRWAEWSPWEGKDPAMARSFAGPPAGVGAVYEWNGNRDVGRGRMEIVDARPDAVTIKLDFAAPFEAHNMAEFTVVPGPGGSTLTWAMHGPSPLMMRVMSLFMNMEAMIGRDFEAGLAKLKAAAER